jgi:arylsulfatase
VNIFGSMGLDVGRDGLSPVSDQYDGAFPFTGTIHEVRYDIESRRTPAADAATEERAGFGTQ